MQHGFLTCSWKIAGPDTMRLASSKLLGSIGCNLQNTSETLMRCVIPRDGCIFIQPDQSGAEALIVAMEAPKGRFRRLFELNIKVHSYMALQIFTEKFKGSYSPARYKSVDPDTFIGYSEYKDLLKSIASSKKEYGLGKLVIHAKNYSMGPKTFQLNVLEHSEGETVLSAKEAKEFLATHEVIFPEIMEWQAIIRGQVAGCRMLRNLFGYPRRFEHIWTDELERQALAFIPQSTVGVLTTLTYTDLWHYIKKNRLPWFLRNNKHDSLLLETPDQPEHIEHGIAKCKEFIGRPLRSTHGEEYSMKVGISIGHNWGHYHITDNLDGMKELT